MQNIWEFWRHCSRTWLALGAAVGLVELPPIYNFGRGIREKGEPGECFAAWSR